jgi:hypothetical protein
MLTTFYALCVLTLRSCERTTVLYHSNYNLTDFLHLCIVVFLSVYAHKIVGCCHVTVIR